MATTEYATLAELKEQLSIEADDDSRDDLLTKALASASRSIDQATNRRFWIDDTPVARVLATRHRTVADEDGDHLLTKDIGSASGVVVEVGRPGAWSDITSSVDLEPPDALDDGQPVTSLLLLSGAWPVGGGQRARVTARWGWPAVPDNIVQACLIQASRLYKRKDSPEGVMGSAEWGVVRLSRRDPDVWALIEPYILAGLA